MDFECYIEEFEFEGFIRDGLIKKGICLILCFRKNYLLGVYKMERVSGSIGRGNRNKYGRKF